MAFLATLLKQYYKGFVRQAGRIARSEEYGLQALSVQSFWRMDRWQAEGMEGTKPLSTDFEFKLPASVPTTTTQSFVLR